MNDKFNVVFNYLYLFLTLRKMCVLCLTFSFHFKNKILNSQHVFIDVRYTIHEDIVLINNLFETHHMIFIHKNKNKINFFFFHHYHDYMCVSYNI
jgi:hypothetical protein